MRSILENRRGQGMMMGLLSLFLVVAVLIALIPGFRDLLDTARDQDSLNCKSNINACGTNPASPCYNSSISTETVACLAMDLYVPYIVLIVLIAGVGAIIAGKSLGLIGGQEQMQPQ